MLLKNNTGQLKVDETFLSQFRNKGDIQVTAVTLLISDEEIRGYRISVDEKGVRLHEIINQSYTIIFDRQVGDEDFSITVDVSSDGKVTYSNPNKDLDIQDLEKNKDVKIQIGKGEKMTLAELVCLDPRMQKGVSKETIKIKEEKPLTSLESTGSAKPETNVIVSPPSSSLESTGATQTNAKKASLGT